MNELVLNKRLTSEEKDFLKKVARENGYTFYKRGRVTRVVERTPLFNRLMLLSQKNRAKEKVDNLI